MPEKYGLSKKDITEEYEDLLFRKVMAQYAENQSAKIEAEIEKEKSADGKKLLKLFSKKERQETAEILWKFGKKAVSVAAMLVLVGVISLSASVAAFAQVREAVAEYLYSLIVVDEGDGLFITGGWHMDTRSQRYILGYIPAGFSLEESGVSGETGRLEHYRNGEMYFSFEEEAEEIWKESEIKDNKNIMISIINDKPHYIEKFENGNMEIRWLEEDAILTVFGPQEMRGILFDIAEGVIPNEKFEGERTPIEIEEAPKEIYPEAEGLSEKERLGQDKYDWKGAWMPTFIPEGFVCHGNGSSSSGINSVTYLRGTDFIIIEQRGENFFIDSEEKANRYKGKTFGYAPYDEKPSAFEIISFSSWVADDMIISIITNIDIGILEIAQGMVPSEYTKEVQYEETRYQPTYIPEGYEYFDTLDMIGLWALGYRNGENTFYFKQMSGGTSSYAPADYDEKKMFKIGESEAILIRVGEDIWLDWFVKNELFSLTGTISEEEALKLIESLVPIE